MAIGYLFRRAQLLLTRSGHAPISGYVRIYRLEESNRLETHFGVTVLILDQKVIMSYIIALKKLKTSSGCISMGKSASIIQNKGVSYHIQGV